MMTDEEKVLRHNFRGSYDDLIPAEKGELVRAFDYDRLAAKLAEAEEDRDDLQIALASALKQLERYAEAAEAALPAAYRLAWEDAYQEYPFNAPTPTAAELMARIQTGDV